MVVLVGFDRTLYRICTAFVSGISMLYIGFENTLYEVLMRSIRGSGKGCRRQRKMQKAPTKLLVLAQWWVSQCLWLDSQFLTDVFWDGVLMHQDVVGLVFHKRLRDIPYSVVVAFLGAP